MNIVKTCPMCNKETVVNMNYKDFLKWQQGALIQEAAPKMHPMKRECLVSGMCFDCQEKVYNTPKPGNEAAFGKRLGECACCGRAVYVKDIVDGKFTCASCKEHEFEEYA